MRSTPGQPIHWHKEKKSLDIRLLPRDIHKHDIFWVSSKTAVKNYFRKYRAGVFFRLILPKNYLSTSNWRTEHLRRRYPFSIVSSLLKRRMTHSWTRQDLMRKHEHGKAWSLSAFKSLLKHSHSRAAWCTRSISIEIRRMKALSEKVFA